MEKYARQAVSEGVKCVDDIHINMDSEIYRVLNLHYNRNNHIEVCSHQAGESVRKEHQKCFSIKLAFYQFSWLYQLPLDRNNYRRLLGPFAALLTASLPVSGAAKLPLRRGADAARVLPRHSGRQGHRAVVEEVNLQGHLAHGRSRARVLQIAKLSGAIGVKRAARRGPLCHPQDMSMNPPVQNQSN